ncbi:MAG: hypothetical protein HOH49_05755 [Kordiimonadaceae bacterium]|nr:hypothetical protein [Kordiimonadaceae bacterium]
MYLRYCPRGVDRSNWLARIVLRQEEVLVGGLTLIACLDGGYFSEGAD